jgi:ParB-like chromosome segregation protein Spo0J
MNEVDQLLFHPLTDIFPLMKEDSFADFVRQIEEHGIQHPITIYEGKVLDGRNRALACRQIGIDCPVEEFKGADPIAFVLNENLHRRHLAPQEKGLALVKAESFRDEAKKRQQEGQERGRKSRHSGSLQNCSEPESDAEAVQSHTRDWAHDAAKQAGLSPRSMYQIQTVDREGAPELIDAVKAQQVSISNAEVLAKNLSKEEQRQIVGSSSPGTIKFRVKEEVMRIQDEKKRGTKKARKRVQIRVSNPPFQDEKVVGLTLDRLQQFWMRATPDIHGAFVRWINAQETDYLMEVASAEPDTIVHLIRKRFDAEQIAAICDALGATKKEK